MQQRFRNYWGVPAEPIRAVGRIARDLQSEAVIVVGLNVLPYFAFVTNAQRIWYAADESVWHHLSQIRMLRPSTWGNIKEALVKGLYERAFSSVPDRVWMVSNGDKRSFQWVTGHRHVDVIPNGIDTEHFAPGTEETIPQSCVFWGRLDFGPNLQALEWFCRKVWPRVRRMAPAATFHIYGFQPTDAVRSLVKSEPGITLTPNLADIRAAISRFAVVVLPFVSGGGIKNKLLEAAAMGKAILCTPRIVNGLNAGAAAVVAAQPVAFANELAGLWHDAARREQLGDAARQWVMNHHTWEAAATLAEECLRQSIGEAAAA
jgi:glycosyltransferase involved in cell wall biosynthesis